MTSLRTRLAVGAAFLLMAAVSRADAQPLEAHGFADVGVTMFTAQDSFSAILGSATGMTFGGGGGIVLPPQIFVDVRASRFKKDGHRVVAAGGEVFDLGIANTITITPVEITAGYRFGRRRDTLRPYAGAGISWYRYQEDDVTVAAASETVSETFTGFHLLGGAEFRVHKYVGVAGEAAWAVVPDALGQQPSSVGTAFGETDLGGATFRVKVIIGR
jgi:opacity protein-like surface antigen